MRVSWCEEIHQRFSVVNIFFQNIFILFVSAGKHCIFCVSGVRVKKRIVSKIGYFHRRYQQGQKVKYARLDDPAHTTAVIWYVWKVLGWRRSINLHTADPLIAEKRAKAIRTAAARAIKLKAPEAYYQDLARLGRSAEKKLQRSMSRRLGHT